MAEQPRVLERLIARRAELAAALAGASPTGIVIVARGSSDYAAIFGRYLLEAATGLPVALAAPSLQTIYDVAPRVDGWLAIGVSQSGRTPEIATVLERFGAGGARTVAITNDAASPLAQLADVPVALEAGDERAVPATKTFTAQLAAMAIVAEAIGALDWSGDDWAGVPAAVAGVLADAAPAERAAERLGEAGDLVVVGRGLLLCVALETALKLREASGVRAEGWSAADFRHGPMTVARGTLPLLAVSAHGPAEADVAELARELGEAGTPVQRLADDPAAELPYPGRELPEAFRALPAVVRAQQLAFALAVRRGVDPDSPPGLRKVTPTT
ncbi:MAG TPA: SIS domain-containing protein [Capillimicrobium sp.]|nr:SIS domain-containing protein [Capillimicrobium sp.]